MFGRATIRLGIGPHSSWFGVYRPFSAQIRRYHRGDAYRVMLDLQESGGRLCDCVATIGSDTNAMLKTNASFRRYGLNSLAVGWIFSNFEFWVSAVYFQCSNVRLSHVNKSLFTCLLPYLVTYLITWCMQAKSNHDTTVLVVLIRLPLFFIRSKLFMVALCNRADHYIFILFLSFFLLLLLSFFPRLISAVGDWMSTILWHMVWSIV